MVLTFMSQWFSTYQWLLFANLGCWTLEDGSDRSSWNFSVDLPSCAL